MLRHRRGRGDFLQGEVGAVPGDAGGRSQSKFFMASLIIQQLYREILSVADENGGKLPNRAVFYADEYRDACDTFAAEKAACKVIKLCKLVFR